MTPYEKAVIEAVDRGKRSEFGLTAVKVELEIKFNREAAPRPRSGRCEFCDEGRIECGDCEGDGYFYCDHCSEGLTRCGTCNGSEVVEIINGVEEPCNNDDCMDGYVGCEECDGEGHDTCNTCEGECSYTCGACDGNYLPAGGDDQEDIPDWRDMAYIHDRVLSKLKKYGLARKLRTGESYHDRTHENRPIGPLVYSKVYHDGTVDTEHTFTLMLTNSETALLLPKIVEAFYSLKDEINQGVDVSNAGMHMALLNSENGKYPVDFTSEDLVRFSNFRKSMILLMPALYFLGTCDERSRPLRYRQPQVSADHYDREKYSAVVHRGGALEFRVFDTCYDYPEAILDNLVVAINCLKYWTTTYTRNHLDKVANNVRFGVDNQSHELKRLYVSNEHINLLNRGLKLIKPDYYTVAEIKAQRNFKVDKRDIANREKRARLEAEAEYKIYEKRFGWENVIRKNSYIAEYISEKISNRDTLVTADETALLRDAEEYANTRVKDREGRKVPLDAYCKEEMARLMDNGRYTLCAE